MNWEQLLELKSMLDERILPPVEGSDCLIYNKKCPIKRSHPDSPLIYGRLRKKKLDKLAHRIAKQYQIGLAEGIVYPIHCPFEVSHLCRNSLCVNPDHLNIESTWINNARRDCHNDTNQHCSGHTDNDGNSLPECIF